MSFDNIHEIKLSDITISDLNVRETKPKQNIDELAASIEEHGLLQPVVLRGNYGSPPYSLIAGQRRFLAHEILQKGTIRAVFAGEIDDTQAVLLSLVENLQSVDLSHADTAKAITALYEKYGKKEKTVQEKTGLSLRTIRDYLTIESQASPKMKMLLKTGAVSKADIKRALRAALGKIKKAEQLLDLMTEYKLTKHQKNRIVEYGESHDTATAALILEKAIEPRVEQSMMVRLPEEVRSGLEQAMAVREQDAEDIVTDVLRDWLSEQGFINA